MPRAGASRKGNTPPAPTAMPLASADSDGTGTDATMDLPDDLWASALPLSPALPTFLASLNRHLEVLPALGPQIRRIGAMIPLPRQSMGPGTGQGASSGAADTPSEGQQPAGNGVTAGALSSLGGAGAPDPGLTSAQQRRAPRKSAQKAKWQTLDQRDGRGRRTLLVRLNPAPGLAVQVWDCTHAAASEQEMSHDPPVPGPAPVSPGTSSTSASAGGSLLARSLERERGARQTAVPREVFRMAAVPRGAADALYAPTKGARREAEDDEGEETALDAQLDWDAGEKRVRLLLLSTRGRKGQIVLTVLDAHDGAVFRRLAVCDGELAELHVSPCAVVVTAGPDHPSIHLITPRTWQPLRRPLLHSIGLDPSTGLPAASLSGRLFAYVGTTEPRTVRRSGAHHPLDNTHGDLVTRASARAQAADDQRTATARCASHTELGARLPHSHLPQPYGQSMQSAIMHTAADLSSEVAKGMWVGLKGLSTMAITTASKSGRSAMTSMLSRSAPTDSALPASTVGSPGTSAAEVEVESEAMTQVATDVAPLSRVAKEDVGRWITVIDLGVSSADACTVADFPIPHDTQSVAGRTGQLGSSRVSKLAFSPTGTHLCAATLSGRCAMIVEIRPKGRINGGQPHRATRRTSGEAWLRYELKRGATPTIISSLAWDRSGRWIACGSTKTLHLFAIHPEGGNPAASNHCAAITQNVSELQPLSVSLGSVYRMRGHQGDLRQASIALSIDLSESPDIALSLIISFQRATSRLGETTLGRSDNRVNIPHGMQDLVLYHPALAMVSGHRLYIRPVQAETGPEQSSLSPPRGAGGRIASDPLSRADRPLLKTVASMLRASDLRVQGASLARWAMPYPSDEATHRWLAKNVPEPLRLAGPTGKHSFANIELTTCFAAPKVLPGSIYMERSVTFGSFGPSERVRKVYRKMASVSTVRNRPDSFDEPLSLALHSQFDPTISARVLPALPNGSPQRTGWLGSAQVLHAAKDIARLGRRSSQSSERESAGRFGDQLSLDEETGFLYDPGHDMEDMTNGSSADETPDDGWDDDLTTGVLEMDNRVATGTEK